jgi:hypothetical protein
VASLDHVVIHHRDLRDWTTDIDETKRQKVEKYLSPGWHFIDPGLCRRTTF